MVVTESMQNISFFSPLIRHRVLIWQLVRREIASRYRGSALGLLWAIVAPMLMLAIYTVVFGFIFEGRFAEGSARTARLDFCLALFCGLNFFSFFADSVSVSPRIILANPNYVTKVIFPLEILPMVQVLAAGFQFLLANVPLIVAILVVHQAIGWTALNALILWLQLAMLTLGICWALASLGVFLRDIASLVPPMLQALFFASAIFYPVEQVPPSLRWVIDLNPLAHVVESARKAVVFDMAPNPMLMLALMLLSILVAMTGYAFFMRTKPSFADVL